VLVGYVTPEQASHIVRFQTDQRVAMRVFLARVLWLQGFSGSGDARRPQHRGGRSRSQPHNLTVSGSGPRGVPARTVTGDLAAAEHYSTMLLDHSTRFALAFWRAWGRSFQGVLVIQRGDIITGLRLLRAGFDEIGEAGFAIFRLIAILMAEALGRAGRSPTGSPRIEEAISRAECTEERYPHGRVNARQGRASTVAGGARRRGGGRGSLPAIARLGPPTRCVVLGTSRSHEPRHGLLLRDQDRSASRGWRSSGQSTSGSLRALPQRSQIS